MRKVFVGVTNFSANCVEAYRLLRARGIEVVENPYQRPLEKAELLERVRDVDAAIVGLETWDEEALRAARSLRLLARFGVGVDNIDVAAATARGVLVTNYPGLNAQAVAELALAAIFALSRQLVYADWTTREGKWERLVGREVRGKILGVIGLGHIGQRLGELALSVGMKVLGYDIVPNHGFLARTGVELVPLDELLRRSDFVSLHVPRTAETLHLIDARRLGLMKPGSFLINMARGGVVDEDALVEALKSGRLAGAAVDVYEAEPVPPTHPLLSLPNVICTPHIGAETAEAIAAVGIAAAQDVIRVLDEGGIPERVLNPESLPAREGRNAH